MWRLKRVDTMLNSGFSSGLQLARSTNKSLQGARECECECVAARERERPEVQPIYASGRFSYRSILVNWEGGAVSRTWACRELPLEDDEDRQRCPDEQQRLDQDQTSGSPLVLGQV